jgi:hypothetical protein
VRKCSFGCFYGLFHDTQNALSFTAYKMQRRSLNFSSLHRCLVDHIWQHTVQFIKKLVYSSEEELDYDAKQNFWVYEYWKPSNRIFDFWDVWHQVHDEIEITSRQSNVSCRQDVSHMYVCYHSCWCPMVLVNMHLYWRKASHLISIENKDV